jgi:hypothetical protein
MSNNLVSKLDSTDATYGVLRWGGFGNPVGNTLHPTREMAPLSKIAPPTVMHPKLNDKPWSVSYAVHQREEPKIKRRRKGARKG